MTFKMSSLMHLKAEDKMCEQRLYGKSNREDGLKLLCFVRKRSGNICDDTMTANRETMGNFGVIS